MALKIKEHRWIGPEECLVLHEMMLLRYGGVAGVRDSALLEAAAARPRERFVAGLGGLADLAACYAAGIVLSRPFASGNLASAFIIATTFLGANGLRFTGKEELAVEMMLELARGEQSEAQFARYLRCNCDGI
jgi:death on curing protein